jgi:hypothetical protein
VRRETYRHAVTADCLVIPLCSALVDRDSAMRILRDWMQFDIRDYYRIAVGDSNDAKRVIFYDRLTSSGAYIAKDRGGVPHYFSEVIAEVADWDGTLLQMQGIADEVESRILLPVAEPVLSTGSQRPSG